MCHELLEIPATADKSNSRIVALRAVINRHQRIIAFAGSIEDVFCYMALVQFFSNTVVICFLGFVIVTVSNPALVYLRSRHFAVYSKKGSLIQIVVTWYYRSECCAGESHPLLRRCESGSICYLFHRGIFKLEGKERKKNKFLCKTY